MRESPVLGVRAVAVQGAHELPLDHREQLSRAVGVSARGLDRRVEIGRRASQVASPDLRPPELRPRNAAARIVLRQQCHSPLEERDRGRCVAPLEGVTTRGREPTAGTHAERVVGVPHFATKEEGLREVVTDHSVVGPLRLAPRRDAFV